MEALRRGSGSHEAASRRAAECGDCADAHSANPAEQGQEAEQGPGHAWWGWPGRGNGGGEAERVRRVLFPAVMAQGKVVRSNAAVRAKNAPYTKRSAKREAKKGACWRCSGWCRGAHGTALTRGPMRAQRGRRGEKSAEARHSRALEASELQQGARGRGARASRRCRAFPAPLTPAPAFAGGDQAHQLQH